MKTLKLTSLILIIILISCQTTQQLEKRDNENIEMVKERVIWVNSVLVNCEGIAPQNCLQIQDSEFVVDDNWTLFHNQIKGFEFEPGYIYQLKINETNLELKTLPADASSKTFTLVEVIQKNRDNNYFRINDIWALESINQNSIDKPIETPYIEIHLKEKKIVGKGTCNSFSGSIIEYNLSQINFGPIASTKMMCPDMSTEDTFFTQLSLVKTFKIKNLTLYFYNELGKEVLSFKKVD